MGYEQTFLNDREYCKASFHSNKVCQKGCHKNMTSQMLNKTSKVAWPNFEYHPPFGTNLAIFKKIKSIKNSVKILKIPNVAVYREVPVVSITNFKYKI